LLVETRRFYVKDDAGLDGLAVGGNAVPGFVQRFGHGGQVAVVLKHRSPESTVWSGLSLPE
jgi:hypothetical protein